MKELPKWCRLFIMNGGSGFSTQTIWCRARRDAVCVNIHGMVKAEVCWCSKKPQVVATGLMLVVITRLTGAVLGSSDGYRVR